MSGFSDNFQSERFADTSALRGTMKALLQARNVLSLIVAITTFGCGGAARVIAQEPRILHARYQFRLIHGQGVPVCDAFLKRLRITRFVSPPYCGVPESSAVSGFSRLHREPLKEGQIVELFPKVFSFAYKHDQDAVPPEYSASAIRSLISHNVIIAWRYSPEISIGNDSTRDNVVVWQGSRTYGSSDVRCGEVVHDFELPDGARSPQIAFILSKDNRRIDESRTQELLGNPQKNPHLFPGFENLWPHEFVPLGYEEGFFSFRDVYYIYAFDGAQLNQLRPAAVVPDAQTLQAQERLLNTLRVFVRQDATTKEVCAYRMGLSPANGR